MKFGIRLFSVVVAGSLMSGSLAWADSNADSQESRLAIARGSLNIAFDAQALRDLGISVEGAANDAGVRQEAPVFFIGEERLRGVQKPEIIRASIDRELRTR